jgi:molybdenum cofactor guanylyltransferase
MTAQEITGFVLAGGLSRRMGQDKSLMPFKGRPLISHAIDILSPVCRKVVISSNQAVYEFTGCEVWPDVLPVHAPMIGLYSCLLRSGTDWNILLSCDMPLVDRRLFRFLLERRTGYETVIPVNSGGMGEPLCGLYKRDIISLLEQQISDQQYGMQKMLGSATCNWVQVEPGMEFYHSGLFSNINTQADLDLLSQE